LPHDPNAETLNATGSDAQVAADPGATKGSDPDPEPDLASDPSSEASAETDAQAERDIWGPPPLLAGEDPEVYASFRLGILNSIKPRDFLEEVYAEDVVAESWQIRRLRKYQDALVKEKTRAKIATEFGWQPLLPESTRHIAELSRRWASGEPEAQRQVRAALEKALTSEAELVALTFRAEIYTVAKIDALLDAAGSRRDKFLREIDRRRPRFASELSRASEAAIDAAYEVVAPPTAMELPE